MLNVQRGEAEASDATLLYQRMLKVLKRRGIEKPAWLTPCEFARVLQEPELALLVEDLTRPTTSCASAETRKRPDAS